MSKSLAISGGKPVRTRPWPTWPIRTEAEEKALLEALHSGVWGVGGERGRELAERYAEAHDAKYGVVCCNGTIALQIALIAAGIEPGDEVITTPYTFMATAAAALTVGAVPVFVDVEEGTHNIDPEAIEEAITPRTRAIYPVHIGGRPANMDRITEIARSRDLLVIEDAAQAWLAAWNGRKVGAIGNAGTFSFQSSKNFAGGEGGIVLTNDEALFQRAWSYHNCGRTMGGQWYQHDHAGLNYRLSEFQSAILLTALDRLPAEQETRAAAMTVLQAGLAEIPGISVPDEDSRVTSHGCHIFMFRLDLDEIGSDKMTFVKALQAEGIPAHPGYTTALYKQSFFEWFGARSTGGGGKWKDVFPRPYADYDLPVCEKLCANTVWIKQNTLLAGPDEMNDVIDAVAKVAECARSGALEAATRS